MPEFESKIAESKDEARKRLSEIGRLVEAAFQNFTDDEKIELGHLARQNIWASQNAEVSLAIDDETGKFISQGLKNRLDSFISRSMNLLSEYKSGPNVLGTYKGLDRVN